MKKILLIALLFTTGILIAADSTVLTGTCSGTTKMTATSDKVNGYVESIKIVTTLTTATNAVAVWADGQMIYTNNAVTSGTVVYPRVNSVDKNGANTNVATRAFVASEAITVTAIGSVATQTNTVTVTVKLDDK